jgi:methylated-DNA-[protein]-cysteine S-methyltransferase
VSAIFYTSVDSPIGELLLLGDGESLHGVYMQDGPRPVARDGGWERSPARLHAVAAQLEEYFAGARKTFDLPLATCGSPFQRRVWRALLEIPYGETESYGELARRIGAPSASRAVGRANGSNPIPIIVPCHRVIGGGGMLTGFGGGVERKRYLLDLEAGASRLFLGDADGELAHVLAREQHQQRVGKGLEPVDDVLV